MRSAQALGVCLRADFHKSGRVLSQSGRFDQQSELDVSGQFAGVHVGSCVIIRGDTHKAEDVLREIGDGFYSTGLNAWVFPEPKRAAVLAALPGCKTVTDGSVTPSENANAVLWVTPYKRALLVKGETAAVREQIGLLGGSWNGKLQGWIFPGAHKDAVIEVLRADPTNTVHEGTEVEAGERAANATTGGANAEAGAWGSSVW